MDNIKVYIKINSNNCVPEINSSSFLTDTTGLIQIDEGIGDRYIYAQNNYFDKPICEMRQSITIYHYKYVDGVVLERTAEEIQADIDNTPTSVSTQEKTDMAIAELTMMVAGLL